MNRSFVKNLIKSKAIQGIVVAGVGAMVQAAELAYPEYTGTITVVSKLLEAGGLGRAFYGRVVAKGPITNDPPTDNTAGVRG